MKSFCIKTNNTKIINYLLKNLDCLDFEDIYYINKKFRIYQNVIVHYKGKDLGGFISILSSIITNSILLYYEQILIKEKINLNYFYFDIFEKKMIEETCMSYILSGEDDTIKFRKYEIWNEVYRYIQENKSVIMDGFVNFRLENYSNTIDDIVDYSVNKYVVEKEYSEFISLLKLYIDSKESTTDLVHLIYTDGESVLLDSNRNNIPLDDTMFDMKYLSDITFSSNDYALNALLTLLPKKIDIHIVSYEDEFINTLKLIFDTRITICTDCNICRTYRVLNNSESH